MPNLIKKLVTSPRMTNLKIKIQAYALIFGIFYLLYRFVFYKMELGIMIREFMDYLITDPLKTLGILFVCWLFYKIAKHTWWWWIFL